MDRHTKIILFKDKRIRSHWDAEQEEWFFSVVDVVAALTDSANPTDYLKKLRKRDEQLGEYIGTNCPQVAMQTESGKLRKTLAATTQQILRVIQSIPSKKAEPFKRWLAEVANQRLDQLQDPELSIEQAMLDYKRLGYSDNWINQRLKSIEIRKELTDEWKKHGLQEGAEFAFLTDVIYKTWAGKTAKEYKQYKGLKKENLRDNMTNKELVMYMLAELSTKEISEVVNPSSRKLAKKWSASKMPSSCNCKKVIRITMSYKPPFTFTTGILNLVAEISQQVGRLEASALNSSPQLRKQSVTSGA